MIVKKFDKTEDIMACFVLVFVVMIAIVLAVVFFMKGKENKPIDVEVEKSLERSFLQNKNAPIFDAPEKDYQIIRLPQGEFVRLQLMTSSTEPTTTENSKDMERLAQAKKELEELSAIWKILKINSVFKENGTTETTSSIVKEASSSSGKTSSSPGKTSSHTQR
jgi:predicted RND superfamily exporter protein